MNFKFFKVIGIFLMFLLLINLGCSKEIATEIKKVGKSLGAEAAKLNARLAGLLKSVNSIQQTVGGIGNALGGLSIGDKNVNIGGLGKKGVLDKISGANLKTKKQNIRSLAIYGKPDVVKSSHSKLKLTTDSTFVDTVCYNTSDYGWQCWKRSIKWSTTQGYGYWGTFEYTLTNPGTAPLSIGSTRKVIVGQHQISKNEWEQPNTWGIMYWGYKDIYNDGSGETSFYMEDAVSPGVGSAIFMPGHTTQVRSVYQTIYYNPQPDSLTDYVVTKYKEEYIEFITSPTDSGAPWGIDENYDIGTFNVTIEFLNGSKYEYVSEDVDGNWYFISPDNIKEDIKMTEKFTFANDPNGQLFFEEVYEMSGIFDPTSGSINWATASLDFFKYTKIADFTNSTYTSIVENVNVSTWEIQGAYIDSVYYKNCSSSSQPDVDLKTFVSKTDLVQFTRTEEGTTCSGKKFTGTATYEPNKITKTENWADGTTVTTTVTGNFTPPENTGSGTYVKETVYPTGSDPKSKREEGNIEIDQYGNVKTSNVKVTTTKADGSTEVANLQNVITNPDGTQQFKVDNEQGSGTFTAVADTVKKTITTICNNWIGKKGTDFEGYLSKITAIRFQDKSIDFKFDQYRPNNGTLIFKGNLKISINGGIAGTLKQYKDDGKTIESDFTITLDPKGKGKLKNLTTGEELSI